jgi:hypothetical protein
VVAVVALLAIGCGSNSGAAVQAQPTSAPTPTPSCTPAPAWLVSAIQEGITVKGAKLSRAYISDASDFVMGPPIVVSDKFKHSWWVGGRINGGGVDDEVATWVTNKLDEKQSGLIFAASAAARRYSDWGADVKDPIAGNGEAEVRQCVG